MKCGRRDMSLLEGSHRNFNSNQEACQRSYSKPENYRHIALMPHIYKIMEWMINERLLHSLQKRGSVANMVIWREHIRVKKSKKVIYVMRCLAGLEWGDDIA